MDKPSGSAFLFTCLIPSPSKEQEKIVHNLVMEGLLLPSCCQEQEVLARSRSRRVGLVLMLSVKLGLLAPAEPNWAGGAFISGGHKLLEWEQTTERKCHLFSNTFNTTATKSGLRALFMMTQ